MFILDATWHKKFNLVPSLKIDSQLQYKGVSYKKSMESFKTRPWFHKFNHLNRQQLLPS